MTQINTQFAQDPKANDSNGEHSGTQQRSTPWIPVCLNQSKRSLTIASIFRMTVHMDAEVLGWPATSQPKKWTKGSVQVDVPWSISPFLQTVHCYLLWSVWVAENVLVMQDGLGDLGSHSCGRRKRAYCLSSADGHWEFQSYLFWGAQAVGKMKIL